MPRDGSGNYTLPAGNPVVDATIITPSWANPTLADIALQLNNVVTRDGTLGLVTPAKFVDGSEALPGIAFNSQPNMGLYREANNVLGISVGGTVVAKFLNDTIQFLKPVNFGTNNPVPPGVIMDFGGTTAPTGYLICDGAAVSRATYAALFAAIGTTWGAGDGSTTFNLPDLRRHTTIGAGGTAAAGPTNTVGSRGGAETHALDWNQMPVHNHNINDPGHSHGVSDAGHNHGVNDPGHAHAVYGGESGSYQQGGAYGASNLNNGQNRGSTFGSGTGIYLSASGANVSIAAAATNVSTYNAGSGSAHNNMQPSAVVNKIIKT